MRRFLLSIVGRKLLQFPNQRFFSNSTGNGNISEEISKSHLHSTPQKEKPDSIKDDAKWIVGTLVSLFTTYLIWAEWNERKKESEKREDERRCSEAFQLGVAIANLQKPFPLQASSNVVQRKEAEQKIIRALDIDSKYVVCQGPRSSGKSTVVRLALSGRQGAFTVQVERGLSDTQLLCAIIGALGASHLYVQNPREFVVRVLRKAAELHPQNLPCVIHFDVAGQLGTAQPTCVREIAKFLACDTNCCRVVCDLSVGAYTSSLKADSLRQVHVSIPSEFDLEEAKEFIKRKPRLGTHDVLELQRSIGLRPGHLLQLESYDVTSIVHETNEDVKKYLRRKCPRDTYQLLKQISKAPYEDGVQQDGNVQVVEGEPRLVRVDYERKKVHAYSRMVHNALKTHFSRRWWLLWIY